MQLALAVWKEWSFGDGKPAYDLPAEGVFDHAGDGRSSIAAVIITATSSAPANKITHGWKAGRPLAKTVVKLCHERSQYCGNANDYDCTCHTQKRAPEWTEDLPKTSGSDYAPQGLLIELTRTGFTMVASRPNFEDQVTAVAWRIRRADIVVKRLADPIAADVFETTPDDESVDPWAPVPVGTPAPGASTSGDFHLPQLGSS
ncbi:hypothetical protein [Sphingomonas fennica]|uniref:hypothetical protein n=1 Tax=Edaphosphingomonas fennica TaxID=114404 RepID=UPI0011B25341|nr:hypothetical protein [Sphingomonas fennica]